MIEINEIELPEGFQKGWLEVTQSFRDAVMNVFKVPEDYLYINEEVEEMTGPALKDEKIIYKGLGVLWHRDQYNVFKRVKPQIKTGRGKFKSDGPSIY